MFNFLKKLLSQQPQHSELSNPKVNIKCKEQKLHKIPVNGVKRIVYEILLSNEKARDDLAVLYAGMRKKGIEINIFNSPNFRREWADLQKKFPYLRGEEWEKRQVRGAQKRQEMNGIVAYTK